MRTVDYKVRPVTRYVVTRFESEPSTGSGSVETIGEFDNEGYANRVRRALEVADPGGDDLPLSLPPSL